MKKLLTISISLLALTCCQQKPRPATGTDTTATLSQPSAIQPGATLHPDLKKG